MLTTLVCLPEPSACSQSASSPLTAYLQGCHKPATAVTLLDSLRPVRSFQMAPVLLSPNLICCSGLRRKGLVKNGVLVRLGHTKSSSMDCCTGSIEGGGAGSTRCSWASSSSTPLSCCTNLRTVLLYKPIIWLAGSSLSLYHGTHHTPPTVIANTH